MSLPIACTLTPSELEERQAGLLPGLLSRAAAIEPIEGGYRVRFAAATGTLTAIAQMIDAERQCCRFLQFTLTIAPDAGPFVLDVTGPPGTREFLAAIVDRSA
jgi:hypothetical protein